MIQYLRLPTKNYTRFVVNFTDVIDKINGDLLPDFPHSHIPKDKIIDVILGLIHRGILALHRFKPIHYTETGFAHYRLRNHFEPRDLDDLIVEVSYEIHKLVSQFTVTTCSDHPIYYSFINDKLLVVLINREDLVEEETDDGSILHSDV